LFWYHHPYSKNNNKNTTTNNNNIGKNINNNKMPSLKPVAAGISPEKGPIKGSKHS
jgi:hypothetical protein